MLKVARDAEASNENTAGAAGGSLLDEVVRDGARLVVRNGYHAEREVITAAGAVPVRRPRVNDRRLDGATGERRRSSSVIFAGLGGEEPAGGRGVAAAVPARPVLFGLRPGAAPARSSSEANSSSDPTDQEVISKSPDPPIHR
jgi:hypothetical protein